MGSRLSSPYEVLGCSYTKPLTFHSLAPSGPSITWRVQWKLFSPNIKSYLGAFKTRQIYFCKRSLFACLRALHFIYRADINWCTGASKTVYIHSKIHFCDTHTTVSPEQRAPWTLLIPCQCSPYSSLAHLRPPSCLACLRHLPTSSSRFFWLGSLRCLNTSLQAALEGEILGLKHSAGYHTFWFTGVFSAFRSISLLVIPGTRSRSKYPSEKRHIRAGICLPRKPFIWKITLGWVYSSVIDHLPSTGKVQCSILTTTRRDQQTHGKITWSLIDTCYILVVSGVNESITRQ